MVLAFRPASLAMLRKVTPSGRPADCEPAFDAAPGADCCARAGRNGASRFSSDTTSAERLSDWRKRRRWKNKREGTFLGLARATLGPFFERGSQVLPTKP